MLGSLPLLCYFGHRHWITHLLGSGYYGFGLMDISLNWNHVGFLSPLFTPLWGNANQYLGAMALCWFIYPLMYFTNVLNAKYYPPMSSGTWDDTGARYNISLIYGTVNLLIGVAVSAFFMGYTMMVFGLNLPNKKFPNWLGNTANSVAVTTDRCFPPASLPPNALN
ncbi:hypothetical protein NA56DRAFT_751977 [Hyaloscypha hepaticicola]|uniref:OPT superfamily oligopeptide transporter n=1 Tax=Hyaloscypha hepaticicola TaxID=2082293 RepID=A0A2J6PUI8_9HELO|nr:hypothetical protein NA56DRAFT_751977 [Hyaloscypha hepaticicola]